MEQGRAKGRRKAKRKRAISCSYCSSERTVLRGFRKNVSGRKQLMLCRSCGRKFTPDDGYLRMRFPPAVIREALSLRSKGFSSAEVRTHLDRKGVRVSRWTILKWARRYHSGKKTM